MSSSLYPTNHHLHGHYHHVVSPHGVPSGSSTWHSFTAATAGPSMQSSIISHSSDSFSSQNTANAPGDQLERPRRPLSAYNLFFQRERERMLHDIKHTTTEPRRSRSGKIGFADMARAVAQRWKTINKEDKAIFEYMANVERKRYFIAIEQWKTALANEAYSDADGDSTAAPNSFEQETKTDPSGPSFPSSPDTTALSSEPEGYLKSPESIENLASMLGHDDCDLFINLFPSSPDTTALSSEPECYLTSPESIETLASMLGRDGCDFFINIFR
jgi:HMG-box domain